MWHEARLEELYQTPTGKSSETIKHQGGGADFA